MKFSSLFKVFTADSDSPQETYFVSLNDFVSFLKSKDLQKKIIVSNVKRALQSYLGGVQTVNGEQSIPVKSLLRYCFHYAESLDGCNFITNIVEREILCHKEIENVSSSFDLYKLIAKSQFRSTEFPSQGVVYDEQVIETLVVEHKPHFTQEEWHKICWFENHFHKSESSLPHEYEKLIALKYSKFQSILSFRESSERLLRITNNDVKVKTKRITCAEDIGRVEITAAKSHFPYILDSDILDLLQNYCNENIIAVISFDTLNSKKNNTIQIVIQVSTLDLKYDISDLCRRAYYHVLQKHNVNIECVYFCSEENLKDFLTGQNPARFQLRDLIETNSFEGILIKWLNEEDFGENTSDTTDSSPCESCSLSSATIRPLELKKIDIFHEWFIETPIEVQLLLETFINRRSLKKSFKKDSTSLAFLANKLEKLLRLYDSLLNIYNRNFIGIFQQANTDELLVEYKSVISVFDITSAAGATTSLTYAESNLRKQAYEDLCYYKTYLKQHPLQYNNINGIPKELVSLRDCHLILMLDNLVRIKSTDEPNRGVCRSKQLCTLPITLQGLPVDSEITSQWHLPECDGSEYCPCKLPEKLDKTDINRTLLQLNPSEQQKHLQFFRLMTWSNVMLWDKLTDEILEHLDNDSIAKLQNENFNELSDIQDKSEKELNEDTDQTEDEDLVTLLSNLNEGTKIGNDDSVDNLEMYEFEIEYENEAYGGNEDQYEAINENSEDEDLLELEQFVDQMSILEPDSLLESTHEVQQLLSSFGFSKFKVPPLLCRHPPPAVGRDDDIYITKQILDDALKKMGYFADKRKTINRILCGPDNKIGKSILSLMRTDPKYNAFLVEFPLLHLRTSKITILFSAYHDAGIIEILKFMRDDNQEDWKRLVSVQYIDIATKCVRRIAVSLHIAFLIVFSKWLAAEEQELFLQDMEMGESAAAANSWAQRFEDFLESGSKVNATFALHLDMMRHCDHVVEIAFAERLGGADGYDLVVAAVKESLKFSFVNNATSYAPYCVQLLHQHFSAGFFHKCMKSTLYSSPFKGSNRNFACDTKRELDQIDALKGFRSGSNITAITSRMSLLDTLNEVKDYRSSDKKKNHPDPDGLGWGITDIDQEHIFPTVALILRQGGLALDENTIPCNVYTKTPILLPSSILDDYSNSTGEYLLWRYIVREKMFNTVSDDMPCPEDISGPYDLIARAKRSKGTTIKRTIKSKITTAKTESQLKEEKRKKMVAKESYRIDCFSSTQNTCQAIVKPDNTKPKVMKAIGMQRALKTLVEMCKTVSDGDSASKLILLNQTHIQQSLSTGTVFCVIEFAGVKFKLGNLHTGKEYIQHVETLLKGFLQQFPRLDTMVICEEKYNFTPDDFKAGTREQRKSKDEKSVDHLKTASDIINENSLNKDAVTRTIQGKKAISTYLAENITKLGMNHEYKLIVDSELHLHNCKCQDPCTCEKYTTPIICSFAKTDDTISCQTELMQTIKQRKDEAEMAVVDWLNHFKDKMKVGECLVSIITSGDIDAIPIHLYAVSRYWNRDTENNFKNPVFVLLQKPRGRLDIYNITGMITLFERRFSDMTIGTKVAFGLCIGGNDFIPKLFQVSHEKVLNLIVSNPILKNNLFIFAENNIILNQKYFAELFRCIYCPKRYQNSNLSYENVRALTIAKSEDKISKGGYRTNDPRKWLPPESAINRLGELVQLQMHYMETVGKHDAVNPDFLKYSCLQRNASNDTEYYFGPDRHFSRFEELPSIDSLLSSSKKRQFDSTPQKGLRRKRALTSTPKSKS